MSAWKIRGRRFLKLSINFKEGFPQIRCCFFRKITGRSIGKRDCGANLAPVNLWEKSDLQVASLPQTKHYRNGTQHRTNDNHLVVQAVVQQRLVEPFNQPLEPSARFSVNPCQNKDQWLKHVEHYSDNAGEQILVVCQVSRQHKRAF